jgi:hypothetical protein
MARQATGSRHGATLPNIPDLGRFSVVSGYKPLNRLNPHKWLTDTRSRDPDFLDLDGAVLAQRERAGLGLIHGCFNLLGVTAAARDEIDRVLHSVRETLRPMGRCCG